MNLNLANILLGDVTRLRHIVRFSTGKRIHNETVAEHSYYTVLYSYLVGEWVLRNEDLSLNFGVLLSKAALHDIEESLTGDIPRPFKTMTSESHKFFNELAEGAAKTVVEGFCGECNFRRGLFEHWKNSKDGSTEGRIVAFADYLSCLSYMIQESNGSNQWIKTHIREIRKYSEVFQGEEFLFLRPLALEARILMEKALGDPNYMDPDPMIEGELPSTPYDETGHGDMILSALEDSDAGE